MKFFKLQIIFNLLLFQTGLIAQCSFQYISNDTTYQDYISLVYARKNVDEIITIGSRINRGIINDTLFNAPVFQRFDYCGSIIDKIFYQYIGSFKLKHGKIPTHNTYKEEPLSNTAIKLNGEGLLLADKATDTITGEAKMLLYKINESGTINDYNTTGITSHESSQTAIKHIIELSNSNILVILWDYSFSYLFFYFDKDLNFLYKKSFNLGRGIRSIKEIGPEEYVCTSLAYDKISFQFYRLDKNGEIKWIVTPPYNALGSAREILVIKDRIYITGGISAGSQGVLGVLVIFDLDGTLLKEFKYDNFYCQARFCSLYPEENSFVIAGYIHHCQNEDTRGSDLVLLGIDTNGTIMWEELFDFRNALGTAGSLGRYMDYGGYSISKARDGGLITNGMSRYNQLIPGGIMHEDALLIKTKPVTVVKTKITNSSKKNTYYLDTNPVTEELKINGPVDQIKYWFIYSLNGDFIKSGKKYFTHIDVQYLNPGLYTLQLIDERINSYHLKFIKL